MVFVTGGAYQGKCAYIKECFHIDDSRILKCNEANAVSGLLDIERFLMGKGMQAACILNVHELIKKGLENETETEPADRSIGKAIADLLERLIAQKPDIIFTMDEVGSGIVPIEKKDRDYREAVGFVGCFLAERADKVVRVISGIGQVIKEHLQ